MISPRDTLQPGTQSPSTNPHILQTARGHITGSAATYPPFFLGPYACDIPAPPHRLEHTWSLNNGERQMVTEIIS